MSLNPVSEKFNVLYVNDHDLVNARFNGYSNFGRLKEMGISPSMIVWNKTSDDDNVFSLTNKFWLKVITKIGFLIDQILSLQSVSLLASFFIPKHAAFKKADVVHLQLLHSQPSFFSLLSLPSITKRKPTVWTLHDPWPLTGHCVHPESCERWKIGCGKCPDLLRVQPIKRDTTALLFMYKKWVYSKSNMEIIVASQWMKNMLNHSPMFNSHAVHVVPFGIDLNVFKKKDSNAFRKHMGIAEDAFVILFRNSKWSIKGADSIIKALNNTSKNTKIHVLTVGDIRGKLTLHFPYTELGWVNNAELMSSIYSSSDLFLSPSHESFGMMALEALSCETPVVCLEKSAIEELCRPPLAGRSIPENDHDALAKAIETLIENPEKLIELGKNGRLIAEEYTVASQTEKLTSIYRNLSRK